VSDRSRFFAEARWTAGVVGLGYVGLPLVATAAQKGLVSIGFDVSSDVVAGLSAGRSHIDDVSDSVLSEVLALGSVFTTDPANLERADVLFICVPSPLGNNREPDLSFIEASAETVAEVARPGQLIVLESTTYPGTTEDYLVPAVEKAGLTLDDDVWVAYSPERVSPGAALKTGDIPKVVGGVTPESGEVAAAVYRRLVPEVHVVGSARAAEMKKLLENTYRAVNIGLVNEVAQLSHELGIDIWEVIDAAATKPFGFQAFYPGPGVGGHCIPLDPQFLAWRGREANFATRFIETAEQINSRMPAYVVERVAEILNTAGKAVKGSRLLAVGLAYKPDVSDDRESASLEVAKLLQGRGAEVIAFDPLLLPQRIRSHGFEVPPDGEELEGFDLAVILTDHTDLPYQQISRAATAVFDTRGVYRRLGMSPDNLETL
jgi:UDP-N-acetyl-D-glucosamine dehydrogenase